MPDVRTSVYGAYAQWKANSLAVDTLVCAPANKANPAVATSGCADWAAWQIGSRTIWNPTRNLDIGVDVVYSDLSKSAFNGALPPTRLRSDRLTYGPESCAPSTTFTHDLIRDLNDDRGKRDRSKQSPSGASRLGKSLGDETMKPACSKADLYHLPPGHHRDRLLVAMAVRMARAALGWSQSEFGRFLGMSQRAIHRIEQGHSEPRRTTLLAIENLPNKAGFRIEDRSGGGFSMIVPAALLDSKGPVDVAAPSLADFCSLSEESELAEPRNITIAS